MKSWAYSAVEEVVINHPAMNVNGELKAPPRRLRGAWRNNPPPCPFCGSVETWLFDIYFGVPVWSCPNEACKNTEHERFFDLNDVKRNGANE